MKLKWRVILQLTAMTLILTTAWCADYLLSTKVGIIAAIIITAVIGVLILLANLGLGDEDERESRPWAAPPRKTVQGQFMQQEQKHSKWG